MLSLDVGEERVNVGHNVQGVPRFIVAPRRLPVLVQQELLEVPPFDEKIFSQLVKKIFGAKVRCFPFS